MSVFDPNPAVSPNTGQNGKATTTQTPAKVQNVSKSSEAGTLMTGTSCTQVSPNPCALTIQWDPVVTDTANPTQPIAVDQYRVTWDQLNAQGNFVNIGTATVNDVLPVNSTKYTIPNLDPTTSYRIKVEALICNVGAASDYMNWPCVGGFQGGTIAVQAATGYGGGVGVNNSAANPEIIQSPGTLTVVTGNNVTAVNATVTQGATVTSAGVTGSGRNFSVALPTITDSANATDAARVHVTVTDTNGCKESTDYYVMDEPAPSCALKGVDQDSTVLAYDKGQGKPNPTSTITLKNTSGNALILTRMTIKWAPNVAKNNTTGSLDSVQFCTSVGCSTTATQSVSQSCANTNATSTAVVTVPSSPSGVNTIAANQTNYTIIVNWNGNMNQSQPITGICLTYTTPFGDSLRCQISPNSSNTCTLGTTSSCP